MEMRSTVEVAPAGPRPAIRLRPVPRFEPPFDDEVEPRLWASASQLALDWPGDRKPRSRALGEPAAVQAPPAVAGASGDARLAVHRFVRLCVEVLNGYRPAAHLRPLVLPAESSAVVAQGVLGARRAAAARRTGAGGRRRRIPPVAVLNLRLCEPRPGAVEAAVALATGERTWAMALRLELHQQSWLVTVCRLI